MYVGIDAYAKHIVVLRTLTHHYDVDKFIVVARCESTRQFFEI